MDEFTSRTRFPLVRKSNKWIAVMSAASLSIVPATERDLDQTWEVHRALILAETNNPALRANPRWVDIRRRAFAAYSLAMEGAD